MAYSIEKRRETELALETERRLLKDAAARLDQAIGRREIVIEMPRMCSVYGKPFAALYVRQPSGLYRLRECVTVSSSNRDGQAIMENIDASLRETGGPGEKCPLCGTGGKNIDGWYIDGVFCLDCNRMVCLGRTKGKIFRCSSSCGSEGELGDDSVPSLQASRQRQTTAALLSGSRPTLPAPSQLRLTNGGRR